jgi:toxin ParE1/3/4
LLEVVFSRLAKADLQSIDEYTEATWGIRQADRYLKELEHICTMWAQNPRIGRLWPEKRPGIRRFEHGRHVIFFREKDACILIIRILHQSMVPQRYLPEEK